jgi:hypothetical protein
MSQCVSHGWVIGFWILAAGWALLVFAEWR